MLLCVVSSISVFADIYQYHTDKGILIESNSTAKTTTLYNSNGVVINSYKILSSSEKGDVGTVMSCRDRSGNNAKLTIYYADDDSDYECKLVIESPGQSPTVYKMYYIGKK